jgi:hypothetical protein
MTFNTAPIHSVELHAIKFFRYCVMSPNSREEYDHTAGMQNMVQNNPANYVLRTCSAHYLALEWLLVGDIGSEDFTDNRGSLEAAFKRRLETLRTAHGLPDYWKRFVEEVKDWSYFKADQEHDAMVKGFGEKLPTGFSYLRQI